MGEVSEVEAALWVMVSRPVRTGEVPVRLAPTVAGGAEARVDVAFCADLADEADDWP